MSASGETLIALPKARVEAQAGHRLVRWRWSAGWPLTVLFVLALIPFLYYPGLHLPDTYMPFMQDPVGALRMTVTLWQAHLLGVDGSATESLLFPYGVTLAGLRLLGIPAWLCQHLWATIDMFAAGVGMYLLSGTVLQTRSVVARLLAACVFEYSAYYLNVLPSSAIGWLIEYALLPYELLLCVRIVRQPARAVRYAIMLGILVGLPAPGNLVPWIINILALFIYATHSMVMRQTSLRILLRPIVVAAAIAVAAMAWWFLPQLFGALLNTAYFGDSLAAEGPALTDQASSILNAFHITTNWTLHSGFHGVPYYRFAPWYLSDPVVAFAASVLAMAGFFPLLTRFARPYSYFGVLSIIAIAMMVGAYPLDHPHVQGTLYMWVYTHIPLFSIFRDGQKFGALLALTFAVGMAASFVVVREYIQRIAAQAKAGGVRFVQFSLTSLLFVVFAGSALAVGQPLWRGQLYQPYALIGTIPPYWTSVQSFLSKQEGRFSIYALPNQYFPVYTWGHPFTDVLDDSGRNYLYISEYVTASALGNPGLKLLFGAVADKSPQELAPLLRLFGIRYVLNRYDIDQTYYPGTVSPSDVSLLLKHTAGVHLVHRFGPVEVYQVEQPAPFVTVSSSPAFTLQGATASDILALTGNRVDTERPIAAPPPYQAKPRSVDVRRALRIPAAGWYRVEILLTTPRSKPVILQADKDAVTLSNQQRYSNKWSAQIYLRAGMHQLAVWRGKVGHDGVGPSQWSLIAYPAGVTAHVSEPNPSLNGWNNAAFTVQLAPSSHPRFVTLGQSYSKGWQLLPLQWPGLIGSLLHALVRPSSAAGHWWVNGYANGWIVPPHQQQFLMVYMPQVVLLLGGIISLGTIIACTGVALYKVIIVRRQATRGSAAR